MSNNETYGRNFKMYKKKLLKPMTELLKSMVELKTLMFDNFKPMLEVQI